MERRSFVQDFFFELMRDSQRVRAVYLAERDRWIRGVPRARRAISPAPPSSRCTPSFFDDRRTISWRSSAG